MLDLIKNILPQTRGEQRCCCFHFGRCGSTVLGNMLNSHSRVNWLSELFHEFHERDSKAKDRSEPIQFLQDNIKRNMHPVFGVEVKFQHLDANGLDLAFGDFLEILGELGFQKFIILRRNHYLRQAISVARGQQSKTWHVKSDAQRPEFSKVELDLDQVGLGGKNRELIECFDFLDATYADSANAIKNAGLDLLELSYELDLESDPMDGYEKTVEFLELGIEKPQVSLQKLGGQALQDMVLDFLPVVERLQTTRFEWMLEQ